jgi:DNA invertase Pin-like site-specific DNA recombinase
LPLRAVELGWELISRPTPGRQVFERRASPTTILAELVALLEAAAEMRWGLAQLQFERGQATTGEIVVRAAFERRLEAAIGAGIRESLARRRAAGVRLGRRPLISDAVLAQIMSDRAAGKGYSQIARELQTAGVPTAQGGRAWYASTVRAAHLRATQQGAND